MRYELNMSLKKPGETGLPDYKVEVKNIASISVLKKVVEYEYKRQSDLLDKGEKPVQETRGIRDMSGETYSQRVKEGAEDYRYFPEPDIPPIEIDEKWQMEVAAKLIELPQEKKNRYMKEYKIDPDSAEVLVSAKTRAMFFEKCIEAMSQNENLIEDARSISKLILGDLARLMKISKTRFVDLKIEPSDLVELVIAIRNGRITGTIAKQVLEEAFKTGTSAEKIIKEKNLEVVSDSGEIEKIVDEVIKSNPDAVESVKKNPNAIKYLVGQVMKASKGKANPSIAEEILSKKLR